MSKKSRRKASLGRPQDENPNTPASVPADVTAPMLTTGPRTGVRSFFARIGRKRKFVLILIVLIAWGGFLIYNNSMSADSGKNARPGYLEFSSEEPDAQVLIDKDDGTEIPIERTAKTTVNLEPGHYKLRLAVPNDNLKLWPTMINMDPNGRAFVKVRKLKL